MERISISLDEDRAVVKPAQFLGNSWGSYLEACRKVGTGYEASIKANVCSIETVPLLVESLRLAGFLPTLSDKLDARIREMAQESQRHVDAASGRIETINTELKKRGLSLFGFQGIGSQWLAPKLAALLGDEMGLGKTIQVLVALPENAPGIVTCPAALKGSPLSNSGWYGECRKWRPDLTPIVLEGRGSFRWPKPGELIIINYDILPNDPDEIVEKPTDEFFASVATKCAKGTVLIPDECHALKGKKTLRTTRFKRMADIVRANDGRVWMLTGTPLLNNPGELWNILEAGDMAKEAFGHFGNFARVFGGYKTGYGMEWGKPQDSVVKLLRKVMLARRREEVLPDLPVKIWQERVVEIDQDTKDLCDKAIKATEAAGLDLEAAIGEAVAGRNGLPGFEEMSRVRAALATAKIPALLDLIKTMEESGEPLVVFSDHRGPVDTLAKRPGWATITGDVHPSKRGEIVDAFQGGRLKGLSITIPAGGVGLTLTRAHQVVFVDMNWTPALNKQAEDRLCRIGQTRGVIVTRLVADHALDDRITERLAQKQAIIEASVDRARVGNEKVASFADQVKALDNPPLIAQDVSVGAQETKNSPKTSPRPLPAPNSGPLGARRKAQTDLERWAQDGIVRVAGMDPDRARAANSVGFSRFDQDFGHSLAEQVQRSGELSEKQWSAAVRLANKYRRQIGPSPEVA